MNTFAPFYILTAALSGDDRGERGARNATLAAQLRRLGFAVDRVNGCYKGESEPALIAIPFQDHIAHAERDALRLARQYGQESILAVDAGRAAALVYCADGRREPLGQFRNVPESVARERDAYTERDGQYYVCGYSS